MELLMEIINRGKPVQRQPTPFKPNRGFHSMEHIKPFYLQGGRIPRKPVQSATSVHSVFHAWDGWEQNNSNYSLASTLRNPEQDIVTFYSPYDHTNPMNWPSRRKTLVVVAIS